jgi:hypothetical protein
MAKTESFAEVPEGTTKIAAAALYWPGDQEARL